jgi:hypothetical protein
VHGPSPDYYRLKRCCIVGSRNLISLSAMSSPTALDKSHLGNPEQSHTFEVRFASSVSYICVKSLSIDKKTPWTVLGTEHSPCITLESKNCLTFSKRMLHAKKEHVCGCYVHRKQQPFRSMSIALPISEFLSSGITLYGVCLRQI